MTEKRYKLSEPNGAYLIDNDRPYAHWINDDDKIIDLLNALHEENVKLQARNKYLATKIQRERNSHIKQHEKWEKEIKDENEELKQFKEDFIKMLDAITSAYVDLLNESWEENEQLQQQVTHLTMYKNLFREFQKQLDGVKKKSDFDHKDFEDLIELTKGHVFDDEHGWIWLPVNDR